MNDKPQKFPQIAAPQVVLVHAETRTGIVLGLNGERYVGVGEKYRVFNSLQDAQEYAKRMTSENSEVECAILDRNGMQLRLIRPQWVTE